jgi:enoyl-CoA hydratase/carnithine racemase
LAAFGDEDPASVRKRAEDGTYGNMQAALHAINNSIKPTVAVVRGGCLGIAFTTLSLVDFIYVSPEATFMVPFMQSF